MASRTDPALEGAGGTASAAIVRQPSDRPDLLIFEVRAKIAKSDIERMAREVEAAIDTHSEVDILLIFATFDGATLGAIFDVEATKASLRSNAHVRRYGVVGAPAFAEAMINLFDPVTPVDAETFDLHELAAARAWIDRPDSASDR